MGKRRQRPAIDIHFDQDSPSEDAAHSTIVHQHTDILPKPNTRRLRAKQLYHAIPASPTKPSASKSSLSEPDELIPWNMSVDESVNEPVDTELEMQEPRKRKRTAGVSKSIIQLFPHSNLALTRTNHSGTGWKRSMNT